jgi:16S rRNA (uracil1498-N3)-methyltransferase
VLPRFHAPDLTADGDRVTLAGDEAQHLTRVLRLGVGAALHVFDGAGLERAGIVEAVGRREVTLRLGPRVEAARELPFRLTLAQALLKGDAMDGIVRDATMLGVTAIQPILSERSDVPAAALERGRRQERWRRIAVSSSKQCRRAVVPEIAPAATVDAALQAASGSTLLVLAEPSAARSTASLASVSRPAAGGGVVVFVGPEGGWSGDELNRVRSAGATFLTLGERTLRADAVALVTLPVLLYAWGAL